MLRISYELSALRKHSNDVSSQGKCDENTRTVCRLAATTLVLSCANSKTAGIGVGVVQLNVQL